MSLKPFALILALSTLPLIGVIPPVAAQPQLLPQAAQPSPPRHVRHRIEIHPRPPLYRRCTDWYELQHRQSGTVLYPQMRCRWVRG